MKGLVAGLAMLVILVAVPSWAGEKEEFDLRLQNLTLQMQNLGLQKQALIKDMDAWQKIDTQVADLNKQVTAFQKQLDDKGFMVGPDGKIVPKPKKEEKKPPEKK